MSKKQVVVNVKILLNIKSDLARFQDSLADMYPTLADIGGEDLRDGIDGVQSAITDLINIIDNKVLSIGGNDGR